MNPPRLRDLDEWPVFDTPYLVEDDFGTYVETIKAGAADNAVALNVPRMMVVAEDSWNEDYTERTIYEIAKIGSRRWRSTLAGYQETR